MPEIESSLGLRLMRPVRARLFMLARAYRNWGIPQLELLL